MHTVYCYYTYAVNTHSYVAAAHKNILSIRTLLCCTTYTYCNIIKTKTCLLEHTKSIVHITNKLSLILPTQKPKSIQNIKLWSILNNFCNAQLNTTMLHLTQGKLYKFIKINKPENIRQLQLRHINNTLITGYIQHCFDVFT